MRMMKKSQLLPKVLIIKSFIIQNFIIKLKIFGVMTKIMYIWNVIIPLDELQKHLPQALASVKSSTILGCYNRC